MTDDDDGLQPAPSRETIVAGIRQLAAGMDDFDLDVQVAITCARRDVAAAWRYPEVADVWAVQLGVLDDVRRERRRLYDETAQAFNPVTSRPLTPEELAEGTDDDV